MQVSDAITKIKSAGHDISGEYDTVRCIEFLNTSVQQVSSLLIASNYPPLVKVMVVRSGDSIPKNFMKPCGTYPIRMTEGKAELLDDFESVKFRYFATPDDLTEQSERLPFDHAGINEVVVKLAIMIALNENEYELSQDKALFDALQQAIAGGMASI